MMFYEAFAPAKINLSLRIIGRCEDGYHLLSSYVVFADVGDHITLIEAEDKKHSLDVSGAFSSSFAKKEAGELWLEHNILGKALSLFLKTYGFEAHFFHIKLEKNLPLGAGIGGGSSDAAALLRILANYFDLPLDEKIYKIALALGADVPVCLMPVAQHMAGIGEKISFLDQGSFDPHFDDISQRKGGIAAVIFNPQIHLSTQDIFKIYQQRHQAFSPAHDITKEWPSLSFKDLNSDMKTTTWIDDLSPFLYNDLTAAACQYEAEMTYFLEILKQQEESRYVNMSGSGSTCFALCQNNAQACVLAQKLKRQYPYAWIKSTSLR